MSRKNESDEARAEVLECRDEAGVSFYLERFERLMPVSEMDSDGKYKAACEACPRYGRNLSCPPYSPHFAEYIEGTETAKVICYRIPLEQFGGEVVEEKYRAAYRKAREILLDDLLRHRREGHIVAGSGACLACETCAVELGEQECRDPSSRVYSLESLGVSVVTLCERAFGFSLKWSGSEPADYVSAIGVVFYKKK